MTAQTQKRILLVIGGGIAAYKVLELIRRAQERGIEITPVMTAAAKHFVTPLSVASLARTKVHDALFALTDEAEMGHIELSRSADLVVVAPATADLLAKMAQGIANDLASTLLLATDKKILVAPAMNVRMWLHPATMRNVETLRHDGVLFVGPEDGDMACGEYGPGRMSEPLAILAAIESALATETFLPLPSATAALAGKTVVITSGPTHEPIDPVRYLANRSSGKQGHALAKAAAAAGARVTLISGPVTLADPAGVTTHHVETARQMLAETEAALPADIFIAAAAVADWRADEEAHQKIKKGAGEAPVLHFVENPDILATIAQRTTARPSLVLGFAAETENLLANAQEKLRCKGADLIVANDVGKDGVMGKDETTVTIITAASTETWADLSKDEVARRLIARLAGELDGRTR
ncbi:bifunctional phosphopantothenoylcysteine decarboxylase/phosphopantothenate--cysteine ligase CoaBC [Methyloferula stellata]|uniref:bifunctional phosphopantothenoylcysteine decarboxylase/phosphopantothenate--cysteine ligase CoaBC n=1 Tax=Methyloferula stellata TaxID=876270 RepID=UPI000378ED6A|nr:bifunctional phosphopantothenoylcysteine decarboxylase/phosphopantothenate--cysteine ligase CoaBC [Methyloferula stellata]